MKRLRYVSRFRQDLTRSEVDALAEHAQQKNEPLGLTGILMTSGQLFFQVLEGPEEAVDKVFATISTDPRHRDVLVLDTELEVTSRLFPDWSMRKVDLQDATNTRLASARETLQRIADLRLELETMTYQLERTIWEELAR